MAALQSFVTWAFLHSCRCDPLELHYAICHHRARQHPLCGSARAACLRGTPPGIGLTATRDKGRGEYGLNGAKHWPCNAAGWDLKGANVNVCIVRTDPQRGGKSGLSAIVVPRGTAGATYKQPISKLGHRLGQNNSIVFDNCRVPEENVFAQGDGRPGDQQGVYLVRPGRRHRRGRCCPGVTAN